MEKIKWYGIRTWVSTLGHSDFIYDINLSMILNEILQI